MMQIKYSPTALEKLQRIKSDICIRFGEERSSAVMQAVVSSVDRLATDPLIGPSAASVFGVDTTYRRLFVSHFHIFYQINADAIEIVDVYHEREDILYKLFGVSTISDESEQYWDDFDHNQ